MSCTKWKNLSHTSSFIWWISISFSLISSWTPHLAPVLFLLLLHVHILIFLLLFLVFLQLFPYLLCHLPLPVTHLIHSNHTMITRSKHGIFKPKALLSNCITYSPLTKPHSISEALSIKEWRVAMDLQFQVLYANNTWSLVPPPPNHQLVGCKWVCNVKKNFDGSINKYKAHLVAKGFHQVPSFDFHDTFSLVIEPATIHVVISLAISHKWTMRQLDFNNAFLNGFLKEDIYMEQPPSFANPSHPTWVYKLHWALYGLKQAPWAWFERLHSKLLTLGFHSYKVDTSLFLKFESEHSLYILIYVDDVLITGNSATQVQDFITQLQTSFALKDLGVPSYFLRLELTYTFQGVLLSQHNYIIDVL